MTNWSVTCLPATFNLYAPASRQKPSQTGIQWVTPSPASKSKADLNPSAKSGSNAYIPTLSFEKPNFSNFICAIICLFFYGFPAASVINTV